MANNSQANSAPTEDFIRFLSGSPTPFHAVENIREKLAAEGFVALDEKLLWALEGGGRYFVIRNASIIAFTLAKNYQEQLAMRIVGAHTDSPCLKVKPLPDKSSHGYKQLGISVYGGVLLNPWFDRDLSIAGQVSYISESKGVAHSLINFERPIALVPSLAIHLNRTANENKSVNPQTELNPILLAGDEHSDFRALLAQHLQEFHGIDDVQEVLDFNLCLFDTHKPAVVGLERQFIASARLDNLLSCYAGIQALINQDGPQNCLVVCNDHEEVGSLSNAGAQGTLLSDVLARIYPAVETCQRAVRQSIMLSADNAHGIHPNYASVHDEQHAPKLNLGPVIKFDANQSYATDSQNASFVRWLARQAPEIPLQTYVTRSDMRCGSTIGPITAAGVGLSVVDVGVPTFAMHSIRETAGLDDLHSFIALLTRFLGDDGACL